MPIRFCVGFFKVIHATSQLTKLGLEGFDFVTLDAGIFVDEVANAFQTCKLQTVAVSEGQTLDGPCTVVSNLGRFNLMIQEDDLGAGSAENLVAGSDFTQDRVGVFHVDDCVGIELMLTVEMQKRE